MARRLEIDPERFYEPMPQEEWDNFCQLLERKGHKIILLDKTTWNNKLTRCKGTVKNIPILATRDDGDRPWAINKIEKYVASRERNYSLQKVEEYTYNQWYGHVNINGSQGVNDICAEETEDWAYSPEAGDEDALMPGLGEMTRKEAGEKRSEYLQKIKYQTVAYRIYYQSICSPITRHHFFTRDLTELSIIFKGQLTGQNNGSAYQTVYTVANNYKDAVIKDRDRGNYILRTAPIIQLVTKRHLDYLHNMNNLADVLDNYKLPSDDSECMVKKIENDHYTCIKVRDIDEYNISEYYPVITYEEIKNITDSLPKIEIDFACCGLGSAGSEILDQVGRSTFFKSFLLCDFDSVEEKNLRNQWYVQSHIGQSKVRASANTLLIFNPRREERYDIVQKECRFQDFDWTRYQCKYVVSGFDSIGARLDLFNYIKEGKIATKYLIDTRYDELTASVYVVDTSNEAEMTYYERGLLSDYEAFKEQEEKERLAKFITTEEEFMKYLDTINVYGGGCQNIRNKYFKADGRHCVPTESGCSCRSANCKQYFRMLWNEHKPQTMQKPASMLPETSCVRQNFIDIYKFSSSFVFSAIREIEAEDGTKPFTHVEAQTEKVPTSMILRK